MPTKVKILTEDEVRDSAKIILGFDKSEKDIKQGTGQITTFNQLGFKSKRDAPDGWYLPDEKTMPAIILETKSEKEDVYNQKWVDELFKNIKIVETKYSRIIGILYNGKDVRVFKLYSEVDNLSSELQNKSYYLALYNQQPVDKQAIYRLTAKINNCLHSRFGIKNLYHRMIFTACALVATKEGATLATGMDYNDFHNAKIIENPICNEANDVRNFIQLIDPKMHLSYPLQEKPFAIYEEDFVKTIMEYEMFKRDIDIKEFGDALLQKILYNSEIFAKDGNTNIVLKKDDDERD